ncbi:hypothetical protein N9Y17_01340 [Gammaproteobacteria bacterium]|nr:hypothetical protein [Gammaproteobacteria bacterium]
MQKTLPLFPHDAMTFDQFHDAGNQTLLLALKQFLMPGNQVPVFYLFGPNGTGKTHLLKAACNQDPHSQYHALTDNRWPEAGHLPHPPKLVALDNMQNLMGQRQDCLSVFNLIESAMQHNTPVKIICAATQSPFHLNLPLKDLNSRLCASMIYPCQQLPESYWQSTIIKRAYFFGWQLPPSTAQYLMHHCERNLTEIFYLLQRMQINADQNHRKLSIPLLKELINDLSSHF